MSNVFQKLGLLKKEEDNDPVQESPMIKPIVQPTTVVMGDSGVSAAKSNTDYDKYLEAVLDKGNLPGVDFLEFHKALNSFEGKPLSEQQKYEFAFIPIQAMGVSTTTLVSTGQTYLNLLDKEQGSFENELADAIKTKVDDKKDDIQKLTAENADLNAKISANTKKIELMTREVQSSSGSIAVEKQAFEFAMANKKSVINERISKIQMYLNGTTVNK